MVDMWFYGAFWLQSYFKLQRFLGMGFNLLKGEDKKGGKKTELNCLMVFLLFFLFKSRKFQKDFEGEGSKNFENRKYVIPVQYSSFYSSRDYFSVSLVALVYDWLMMLMLKVSVQFLILKYWSLFAVQFFDTSLFYF